MKFRYVDYKTINGALYGIEGKTIWQFNEHYKPLTFYKNGVKGEFINGPVLAYRRVSKPQNYRTTICSVIRDGVIITRSINILELNDVDYLYFLCGIMNSFVIDYFVRKNVMFDIRLFNFGDIPIIPYNRQVTELAIQISKDVNNQSLKNELDILVAKMYGLNYEELKYILSTFNLVEQSIKDDILERHRLVI